MHPHILRKKGINEMELNRRILPYYMTYPGAYRPKNEETVIRDMEYLQQMYPGEVRRYQQRIAQLLDKVDYEGSMIYDEYPDRFTLERLAESALQVLRREEEESGTDNPTPPEKWMWLKDLIQVLICNEVYKRRHGGRRGIIYF